MPAASPATETDVLIDLRPFPSPDEAADHAELARARPELSPGLQELIKGDPPPEPWQHQRYSADNRVWQAAALRKRAHYRRSNVSLGVCSVDLSGPHEPSPRPGCQIHRNTVTWFLALTLRPDQPDAVADADTQTSEDPAGDPAPATPPVAGAHPPPGQASRKHRPLIYAALLGSKAEASEAIKACWQR